MKFATRFLLISCLLAGTSACATGVSYVELKGQRFSVEIADDRDEQTLGLMFRRSLEPDHGMLFIFPGEAPRAFWMKNTYIPLDIMYFDSELELVSLVTAQPCRTEACPGYPSEGPAMYVLELNAGKASELGLEPGDRMVLMLDNN
ncbi:MAG: DUF192 domain-containing protein [Xanthomonadales bacterium]|nr:DUF192 domain-containing protein [Xanthomonadales bacterium]NNL95091.1 DUF192 domain-containing protein [Xanthomonadales bacterium]